MSRLAALHRRVVAGPEHPRRHPPLHRLADRPVLPVHQVPEVHRVRRIEIRAWPSPSGWNRNSLTIVVRSGPCGQDQERRHVLGAEAQQEVGIDQLALVADLLVLVEPVERHPVGGAAGGEGPGALAVRDAALPVELGAAALLERRDEPAELGVHRAAVVALVVVLEHHLPVGLDLVRRSAARRGARRADSGGAAPARGRAAPPG